MWNTVFVFGAQTPSGVALSQELLASGVNVIAVIKPSADFSVLAPLGIEIVANECKSKPQASKILSTEQGKTAIVVFLGGKKKGDFIDAIPLIEAAEAGPVDRFIMVTTIGCGTSKKAISFTKRFFQRGAIKQQNKAEKRLKKSKLSHTIIRPGDLTGKSPTGQGMLVDDPLVSGALHPFDLASLISHSLMEEETIGGVFSAIDKRYIQENHE